tara:strand:- start:764 stop:970 length:207 start_codon:yes stop_codon:yes gene_type:complete
VILIGGSVAPATFADHISAASGIGAGLGGVTHPGSWYAGENLKVAITSSTKYVMQNTRTVQIFGFQCG